MNTILDSRPLHEVYAGMADGHRAKFEAHTEDADLSPAFTQVKAINQRIAKLHAELAAEYSLLSGVHQEAYNEAHREDA